MGRVCGRKLLSFIAGIPLANVRRVIHIALSNFVSRTVCSSDACPVSISRNGESNHFTIRWFTVIRCVLHRDVPRSPFRRGRVHNESVSLRVTRDRPPLKSKRTKLETLSIRTISKNSFIIRRGETIFEHLFIGRVVVDGVPTQLEGLPDVWAEFNIFQHHLTRHHHSVRAKADELIPIVFSRATHIDISREKHYFSTTLNRGPTGASRHIHGFAQMFILQRSIKSYVSKVASGSDRLNNTLLGLTGVCTVLPTAPVPVRG